MLSSTLYGNVNILRVHELRIAHALRYETGLWQKRYMVWGWKSRWSRKIVFMKIILTRVWIRLFVKDT